MFRGEMSAQARPPLDGLAQEVLGQGRRARRVRTAKIASAALAAVGLIAGVAVAGPALIGGHPAATQAGAVARPDRASSARHAPPATQTAPRGAADATGAQVIITTASSSSPAIPQPPGSKAPTTGAAILDELLKLLPPGATSNYAVYGAGGAQAYLNGSNGLGMIRIFVSRGSLNPGACASPVPSDVTRTCSTLPNGAAVVTTKIPGNCIEPLSIVVDHGDGTVVEVNTASCLAWNGHTNPPASMAITAAQALQIAANPAWGAQQMDAAVVSDGASRFADVSAGS
jgi:hypothetical protein